MKPYSRKKGMRGIAIATMRADGCMLSLVGSPATVQRRGCAWPRADSSDPAAARWAIYQARICAKEGRLALRAPTQVSRALCVGGRCGRARRPRRSNGA